MKNNLELQQAAQVVLTKCMGVRQGENVLVVTDDELFDLAEIFYQEAQKLACEASLIVMKPRHNNAEEPVPTIAAAMAHADVALLVTSKSLSHTEARKKANEKGTRVASLPGLTADMMARTLNGDYYRVEDLAVRFSEILNNGSTVEIKTAKGTQLTFSIAGRSAHPDTGILTAKGCFGNLPAGEAYVAPLEGTANGTLVIDGSIAGIGKLSSPLYIKVQEGYAVEVTGGEEAAKLNNILDKYGKEARNIAELGIGTNPYAKLTGEVLEDEKILGSIHIALGDNHTFGGKISVASHLDGVVLNPTVIVDGKEIMREGKILI